MVSTCNAWLDGTPGPAGEISACSEVALSGEVPLNMTFTRSFIRLSDTQTLHRWPENGGMLST
ncbi:hypothetical protein Asp14428_76680 [Actinoplanes sp. NBRC 14428]|nr:hypothetical protein Asp14428_76680 [Actinoplanes sp. NBRC 14428]